MLLSGAILHTALETALARTKEHTLSIEGRRVVREERYVLT